MVDPTMETAAFRNWMAAVRTKGGAHPKKSMNQVFVVKAHSLAKAEIEVWKKVLKGKFKHSPRSYFTIDIQEVKDGPNGTEQAPGDSEGIGRADSEAI